MLATATHDTKLGEDVRARINVLSEMPDEWATRGSATGCASTGSIARSSTASRRPIANDEYRFYQALVGVWPPEIAGPHRPRRRELVERLQAYMIKAVKEAKLHTSWLTPNQEYEDGRDAVRRARR